MVDQVANFKKVTVSTGYDGAAVSIVLEAGQGAELPNPSGDNYNLVWWDSTNYPDPADDPNVEIVRVTAKSTDTLTVTRNQEGSGASTKNTGSATYLMILSITANTITDLIADVERTATVIVGKSGHVDYLTTDYGSDDACIQAAIDYVDGLGGGSVLIREGTYIISTVLSLYDSIKLYGIGRSTKLVLANAVNDSIIKNSQQTTPGNTHIEICDMYIDGNGNNQTSGNDLINLVFAKYSNVHDIYSQDAYYNNIRVGSVSDYSCIDNCKVVNSISQPLGISIYASGNQSTRISNCFCYGSYKHAISAANCKYVSIENCICENSGNWAATLEAGTQDSIISNCISYNSYAEGFTMNYSGERCKIIGCVVTTGQTDFGISSLDAGHATITGCTVYNSFKSGISVHGDDYSVLDNVVINCCTDTDVGAFDSQMCGISLQTGSTNCLIQGNHIMDTRTPKKHVYAIGEFTGGDGDPVDNYFVNNTISGFLTAAVHKVADDTIIRDNIGYNPAGAVGPPAVPATTVNYTNAYGYPCQVQVYGGTVTEIDIDDIATGLTSGVFIIPPGGTINITYSAAPSWLWWGL